MFISIKTNEFVLKFAQILIAFIFCFNSVISSQNDYRIGYNHGFRDAQRGLANRFEHRFDGRRQRHRQYQRPDYEEEPEEYDSDYDYRRRGSERQRNRPSYYGKIFGVDDQVLSRGLTSMSGDCRMKIKPEFGTCIERAANKFDVNIQSESLLGENDCKALWALMCCSEELITKQCRSVDVKVIQVGFSGIQKTLELKGCAKSPRSAVQCSK